MEGSAQGVWGGQGAGWRGVGQPVVRALLVVVVEVLLHRLSEAGYQHGSCQSTLVPSKHTSMLCMPHLKGMCQLSDGQQQTACPGAAAWLLLVSIVMLDEGFSEGTIVAGLGAAPAWQHGQALRAAPGP